MNTFFKYINSQILNNSANLKTVNLTVKIFAGLISTKFIAVFIGPEGMALIGNLRNFLSAIQSITISGLYKGLVKFIGQVKNNDTQLSKVLSTSFYFGFFTTLLFSLLSYYNASVVAELIFNGQTKYTYVIEIMALVLPLYALNMYSFAIMNGFSKYKILLVINITGQVLGLLVTLLLIYQNNIHGALVALVITPALNLLITIVGILNRKNLVTYVQISQIDFSIIKNLSPYMIMALVSAIAMPIVLIAIRNYIIVEIGAAEAGHWEAVNRISDYYLMFVNSLIVLYILPRFTEIKTQKAFKTEVYNFYKKVMPIFAGVLLIIYFCRMYVIRLIFTEDFAPAESLFGYMLLGDFLRVLSMVIAYQFVAKKMFTHFIILEIFLFVIIYLTSVYLIDIYGLKGAVMGHFVGYLLHFGIILLLFFGSSLFGMVPDEDSDYQ